MFYLSADSHPTLDIIIQPKQLFTIITEATLIEWLIESTHSSEHFM